MVPMFLKIIFPPPPSLFVTAMSVANIITFANAGFMEMRGIKHMQYSKFWNAVNDAGKSPEANYQKPIKVMPSRTGMLLSYSPAFLAGVASFALFPDEGLKFLLVRSALTTHFLKRILEVLFIHKYSGGMSLDTAVTISISYFLSTSTMIYAQHLTQGLPQPAIDLTYPGILLFLIGISGNFYHHYLLSNLRSQSTNKEYKVPTGGLFDFAICPHYFFEILVFWGISFISQTLHSSSVAIGTTFYLMGRSYATRRWYLSKFENLSRDVKALIPFVF